MTLRRKIFVVMVVTTSFRDDENLGKYKLLCSILLSTIPVYVAINNLILYIYIYIEREREKERERGRERKKEKERGRKSERREQRVSESEREIEIIERTADKSEETV